LNKNRTKEVQNIVELFYASILKTNVQDILDSNDDAQLRTRVIAEILHRADLPFLSKLPSSYDSEKQYFQMKSSLILEEARCQISKALQNSRLKRDRSSLRKDDVSKGLVMKLVKFMQRKKTGHITITFEKEHANSYHHPHAVTYFTPQEQYTMKPGCLLEIQYVPRGESHDSSDPKMSNSAICFIQPNHNFGKSSKPTNAKIKLVMCNTEEISLDLLKDNSRWRVVPIVSMVSAQRQFEGCMRSPRVSFMPNILASTSRIATMKLFPDVTSSPISTAIRDPLEPSTIVYPEGSSFPILNKTQERAANVFLKSPPSTLTLVQGPPGTGKTTFLVSLLYKNFLNSANAALDASSLLFPSSQNRTSPYNLSKRVIVSAPTNRAVSVLANKFLDSIEPNCPLNLILIGVEDKLLDETGNNPFNNIQDDPFTFASLSPNLRSIYVYSWMETMMRSFGELANEFHPEMDFISGLVQAKSRAKFLEERLQRSIPSLYVDSGTCTPCKELVYLLEDALYYSQTSEESEDKKWQLMGILGKVRMLIENTIVRLRSIQPSLAITELLATANVIFCTLSTAGTSLVKSTKNVDDLFVDEAAAAGEAELSIPFHLMPNRLLAVGDPKQLPITVMSKKAADHGLGTSLHQRLMYECGKDHIMLDVQYRMRTGISSFPSRRFYDGKIANGENVTNVSYHGHTGVYGGAPYTFLNIVGEEERSASGSFYNVKEAQQVVKLARSLSNTSCTSDWALSKKIKIITFYQGQVQCIKNFLRSEGLGHISVATVDASQGSEADFVIISFVRSTDKIGDVDHTTAGFLADDRRINVALTRAKFQLICVGNAQSLTNSGIPTLKAIIDDAQERKRLLNYKK